MALYRVLRVGGPSDPDNKRFDKPTVVIDSFGADRMAATTAALNADDAMRLQLQSQTTGGATVTRVETITGPHWAPWSTQGDKTTLRRFTATYRLHLKCKPSGYVGVEALLVAWLTDYLGTRVSTDVPADLADLL